MDNLKLPPHNIEAEQSVIGGLLLDNDAYDKIHSLKPSHFYQHDHAEIYRAVAEMLQESKQVDIVTLAENLEAKSKLTQVGGIAYLGALAQNTPSASNIKRYAEIVHEKFVLRNLIAIASKIQDEAYGFVDVKSILDRAQASIMAISEQTQSGEPKVVGDLLLERYEHFDKLYMGEIKAIGTGLIDLDEKLGGGFRGGQLVVIAARPAMGKSALAVQLAEHIQTQDKAGLIFSCEMPNAQIVDRIISAHARVPSDVFQTGKFQNDDWDKLTSSIPKIQMMNLLVDDNSFTVNAIASKARTVKRKYGLSVIVVDYIQLLEGVGDIREQQVASISRGLKRLSIELDVPIIALTQLNRGVEARLNKRPVMSDIRESGAIEQDADLIIAIYRDEEYNPDSADKGTAELLILKNRSGKTTRLRTTFVGEYTRFENFAGMHFSTKEPDSPKTKRGFND
jgi:replicative DNA helicase